MDLPPRPTLARAVAGCLVVALLAPGAVSGLTYDGAEFGPGVVVEEADGPTYVGVQGFYALTKKPARVAALAPNGSLAWRLSDDAVGASWYYDVDPLANGNLLVTSAHSGRTVVFELDTETREVVWRQALPLRDTHDVDLIDDDELLVANIRQWNHSTARPDDRIFVYNLTREKVTWEWVIREHYPRSTDGGYHRDWSHVNDVDEVGEGRYLVSLRNFDQVILVNRSTKAVEMRLGRDGDHSVLYEQHNPDFLVSEDGRPTILVADSENDRVVEYERRCEGDPTTAPPADCGWRLTWELSGPLNWPRDADRMPNGNTLVTDSLNQRVVEVAPNGTVVWEAFATWGPYDADRPTAALDGPGTGGSARGPTMADLGTTGSYRVSGGQNDPPVPLADGGGPAALLAWAGFTDVARTWSHVTPWAKPVWMTGWDFALALVAVLLLLGWGVTEASLRRDRIRAGLGRLRG